MTQEQFNQLALMVYPLPGQSRRHIVSCYSDFDTANCYCKDTLETYRRQLQGAQSTRVTFVNELA